MIVSESLLKIVCQAQVDAKPDVVCSPFVSFFKYLVCIHRGRVCPGSVGTSQALLQGWHLCDGYVCLANVPDLVRWLILN